MKTLKNTARAVAFSLVATLTVLAGATQPAVAVTVATTSTTTNRVVEHTSSFSGIERSQDYDGVGQSFAIGNKPFNLNSFSAVVDSVYPGEAESGPQVDVTLSVFEGNPRTGTPLLEQFYPRHQFPSHADSPTNLLDEHWTTFEFPEVPLKPYTRYAVTLRMGEFDSVQNESMYCKSIGPDSPDYDEWWYDLICGSAPLEKEHVLWAMAEPRPASDRADKKFPSGHAWTTFGGHFDGQTIVDGTFGAIADYAYGDSADYYDPDNADRWSSMIFRAQGPATNAPSPGADESAEVILDVMVYSADKPGWSWAAASQAIIGYHRQMPFSEIDQCEIVKSARDTRNCDEGPGAIGDILNAFHKNRIFQTGISFTETMSFAQIKEDIIQGLPIIARLENVTVKGVTVDDQYAIIRGYDTRNEGVHFVLIPEGKNDIGDYTFPGGALPLEKFINMTEPYELAHNSNSPMTWNWAGTLRKAYGEPDAVPEPEEEEGYYDEVTVDEAIRNSTALYFMMTVAMFRNSGIPFPCEGMNLEPILEGNAEMNAMLNDTWKLHALTQYVRIAGSPHFSVARTTPVGELAGELYPSWVNLFSNTLATENPLNFSLKESPGFEAAMRSPVLGLAWTLGVCPFGG